MRPWQLADLTYRHLKDTPPPAVAVLPFGATEPHNLHLPYATDTIQVDVLADRACQRAHERGARVVALPTIPYGTETNQHRFPLSMNLNPTTLLAVVTDLLGSLAGSGVQRCVILNGHGGNDFKWMLRQLHGQTPVHLFLCNWFKVATDRHAEIFSQPDDHAGEMETSLMLVYRPDLVALEHADDGRIAKTRFEAVNRGWVELTRPWHLLTTNSGAGNPHAATAAKGEQLSQILVERLGDFLVELAASPLDEQFPF